MYMVSKRPFGQLVGLRQKNCDIPLNYFFGGNFGEFIAIFAKNESFAKHLTLQIF